MKRMNYYLSVGLLLNSIFLLSSRFHFLPDFFEGFCVSLGIVLVIYGLIIENHNRSNFRNCKKKILAKVKEK